VRSSFLPAPLRRSLAGLALALAAATVAVGTAAAQPAPIGVTAGQAAAAGQGVAPDSASAATDATLADLVAAHPVFGPALAYRSAATDAAERALAAAEDDLRRIDRGLSAELVWRPSLGWRGSDAGAEAGLWRSELTASFGWRHDAAAVVRARIALHRAAVAHAERVHRDLREAVSRHVELQRAFIARTIAEDAAAGRTATLVSAERVDLPALVAAADAPEGTPEPRTLLASRLEAERAAAAVERAGRDLAEAQRQALAFGIDPTLAADLHLDRLAPLALEGWRLWLPAADPWQTPTVIRSSLDLADAEAAARRVRAGGLVDDLRLEAVRTGTDARWRGSLRLDDGRPSAAFDVTLRPASRSSWAVGGSAVIRLDDASVRDLERADAAVADAAATWADAAEASPWLLALAQRAALDAEEDLAFGERGLALARLGLREALAAWRTRDADDPAARERADAALARAAIALERERDAYYHAWNRYLLEAERYWTVAGVPGGVLAPP
jgi:hypothetical protein